MKKYNKRLASNQSGFTLIELLVVIAIVGILSGVILASLNSARKKGQVAAIKSNLRNVIPKAELTYDDSNPKSYINVCEGVGNMITAINNVGGNAFCQDSDTSWSISSKINSDLSSYWSVGSGGFVSWDIQGVDSSGSYVPTDVSMTWTLASSSCATVGGRLPTLEELQTFSDATWSASNSTTHTPPGFIADSYWVSTTVPSNSDIAYKVNMFSGSPDSSYKYKNGYVRCVR
jgi:prepilin-type N-terminal cleavage/methylation domain-containing protein